jgi:threonine dehydrogenase-like Zn-dependent dehydrogenase
VKVPPGLKNVGVLLEPFTVVQKGITQAYEAQRRLRVWRPRKAAVMGAGTIGLLAALALRLRNMEVTVFARQGAPTLRSELLEAIDARYISTTETPILEGVKQFGPFDIIFEATGASSVVFDSMQALAKNGALVLSSVTGGDRRVEVPADKINLEFVLGNRLLVGTVNANREYFESGVRDLAHAEAQYSGWLKQLLTHPVEGLENYQEAFKKLDTAKEAIKVYYEVAAI